MTTSTKRNIRSPELGTADVPTVRAARTGTRFRRRIRRVLTRQKRPIAETRGISDLAHVDARFIRNAIQSAHSDARGRPGIAFASRPLTPSAACPRPSRLRASSRAPRPSRAHLAPAHAVPPSSRTPERRRDRCRPPHWTRALPRAPPPSRRVPLSPAPATSAILSPCAPPTPRRNPPPPSPRPSR